MKKSVRTAGIVFLVLSLAEVIPMAFGAEALHPFLKPLLIPSLAVAALCALLPEYKGRKTVLLAAGMALHTAGDILLLMDSRGVTFFTLGLAAFLLGHICYLWVMLTGMVGLKDWREILLWLLPLSASLAVTGLLGEEGFMHYAIDVYAFILLYELATGVVWMLRKRPMGSRILWGAVFFIISDVLLAMNAFRGIDFPTRHALVMGTYLLAEWLLVSGMVRDRLQGSQG
ncbi:MAG: lysoplasmalogenase [Bacteroidales bacterium]|jgi:uncharacterized membrane protein YhhN|nr:lysoplasmalogenase [Bacteroidales bacterium]